MPKPAFKFDGDNPAAQRVAERQAARFVADITAETRGALRLLILRSIREGLPPYDAARIIVSMIGLTEKQAAAAWNYRISLIDSGLSLAKVDQAVGRYVTKQIRTRADTIARTEIMAALNTGAQEAAEQAQRDGLLGKNPKKEWLTAGDERTCPLCAPMDGAQAPLKGTFSTPAGTVDGPPLHPRCRCTIAVTA
jgi:SPP1 gp7 family putative phage head morphogenesis protein